MKDPRRPAESSRIERQLTLEPRWLAGFLTLSLLVVLLVTCLLASRHCRRPGLLWGVGLYFMSLLAVFAFGLLSGSRFETAFAELTMLTFPFSWATDHTITQEGFGSAGEIAINFVRYCLVYGGLNGVILTGFFRLVFAPRAQPR